MEIKKSSRCHWCGYMWHIFGVIFLAFGLSLLIFFPDFFHNHLLKVSSEAIRKRWILDDFPFAESCLNVSIQNISRVESPDSSFVYGHFHLELDQPRRHSIVEANIQSGLFCLRKLRKHSQTTETIFCAHLEPPRHPPREQNS